MRAFQLGILTGALLLVDGCAASPGYDYVQQKNSACVEGAIAPMQRTADYGSCSIAITQVDGLGAYFDASRPGANWSFTVPRRPLYLAPGRHALKLDIAQVDEVIGVTGHDVGVVGAYASGSQPTLTAEFMANHVYRFTANLNGSVIDVTLWDESGGTAARSQVTSWTLDSNKGYSENPAPGHSR